MRFLSWLAVDADAPWTARLPRPAQTAGSRQRRQRHVDAAQRAARREEEETFWDQEYERRVFAWAIEGVRPSFKEQTWQAFWQVAMEGKDGIPYMVMECINGVTLQERLNRKGPLELREVVRIGMQTAKGLAAAHAQGLVHRDIKPANILLENGVERVKISDFGLARAVDDASLTQSGVVAGTMMLPRCSMI